MMTSRRLVPPTLHIRLVILGVVVLFAFIGASQARAVPAERDSWQDEATSTPTETPLLVETPLAVSFNTVYNSTAPFTLDASLNAISSTVWLPYIVRSNAVEYGIANNFYQDQDLVNHPAVIFSSDFNDSDWYQQDFHHTRGWWYGMIVPDPSLYANNKAIEIQNLQGTHDPRAVHISLPNTVHQEFDKLHLRWYRKYEAGFDWACAVKTNGVYAKTATASPAGTRPTGYDKYSAKLVLWRGSNGQAIPKIYTYHPDQSGNFGDNLSPNVKTGFVIQSGRWYSYELMLKANTPGQRNGEIKLWVDGELISHYPNLRFRDTESLKINELELSAYVGDVCTAPKDQKLWDDHLVLATEYIGPMRMTPMAQLQP